MHFNHQFEHRAIFLVAHPQSRVSHAHPQIEHHVWPDLSMLSYQKAAPLLRAICEKHNVPYIQESVWKRLSKTVDIMTGHTSMRKYPNKWEVEADLVARDGGAMAAGAGH